MRTGLYLCQSKQTIFSSIIDRVWYEKMGADKYHAEPSDLCNTLDSWGK